MPRAKRAPVTTKSPTKQNGKRGNAHASADLESVIRSRAYELYEKRGRQDGYAQDDWLQAEAEVRSRGARTA